MCQFDFGQCQNFITVLHNSLLGCSSGSVQHTSSILVCPLVCLLDFGQFERFRTARHGVLPVLPVCGIHHKCLILVCPLVCQINFVSVKTIELSFITGCSGGGVK